MALGQFQEAHEVSQLLSDGAKLAQSILAYANKLAEVDSRTRAQYEMNAALFSWIAREGMQPAPELDAVVRRLAELAVQLEMLKVHFAGTYNLPSDLLSAVAPPRTKKTYGLIGPVLFLGAAWEVMTQTSMQYPNKYRKGGLFGERPAYDDGYFILLMLNISASVSRRTVAETAIKQALAVKRRAKEAPQGWTSTLDSAQTLLRSKWAATQPV
jgi:hypothetical protein